MALPPVSPRLPALQPATAAPRADAVRAAQRAFFETALAGEMTASVRSAPAVPAAVETAGRGREVRAAIDPDAPAPTRPLRPGSLLDIKV